MRHPFFLFLTLVLAAAMAGCHEKPPKPSVATTAASSQYYFIINTFLK